MRIAVTLDADVVQKLKRRMVDRKLTLKDAVNQALRAGLVVKETTPKAKFEVKAHSFGLLPGIDPDRMNQLSDELEAQDVLAKMRR
jgi:hypothetical protein